MASLDYSVLNQEGELLFTTHGKDMAALRRCERQQRQHWHHRTHGGARATCADLVHVGLYATTHPPAAAAAAAARFWSVWTHALLANAATATRDSSLPHAAALRRLVLLVPPQDALG